MVDEEDEEEDAALVGFLTSFLPAELVERETDTDVDAVVLLFVFAAAMRDLRLCKGAMADGLEEEDEDDLEEEVVEEEEEGMDLLGTLLAGSLDSAAGGLYVDRANDIVSV